jgi:hypothetical protein
MKTLAHPRDVEELRRRLRNLHPDSARRWGRMSAHQMVCHVADAFRMAMGRRPCRDTSTGFGRTGLKWIALYVPMRWPAGIQTSAEIDQAAGCGTPPQAFAADLAEVDALLTVVSAFGADPARPPHPVFGPLSPREWLRWGYLHTDHHLRQFGV